MEGINPKLEPLIGNDNGLSAQTLLTWLKDGEIAVEDLRHVLDDDTVQDVADYAAGKILMEALPHSQVVLNEKEDRTEVYFWGVKGSGKSAVIGSIIAACPECIDGVNTELENGRGTFMRDAFVDDGDTIAIPYDTVENDERVCDIINADFKDKWGRKHPLALIEVKSNEDSLNVPKKLVKSTKNDKIHILCYDCTRKDNVQDREMMSCLAKLEQWGVLGDSVGIYLLVTKTDALMGVPVQYRTQAAQTLITARHKSLWMTVKSACYRMYIYDATPIPYSVGNVRLESLVKTDLAHARKLIEKPLLLKSHAYRTWLGKLLRKGNAWTTSAAIILLICIAGYLAYGSFEKLDAIPGGKVREFDYVAHFKNEVTRMKSKAAGYYRARPCIEALENELKTEKSIKLKSGKHLLTSTEVAQCEGELYDEVATLLYNGFKFEFNDNWGEGTIQTLLNESRKVLQCKYIKKSKSEELRQMTYIAQDYFKAKELIEKSRNCETQEDVEWVENNVDEYNREPLTKCEMIREGLENAVDNARRSYESHKQKFEKSSSGFHIDWRSIFN